MGSATRIVRMALHAFFSHYHPAASAAALLALPFSAAALVSRSPALLQLAAPPRAILLLQPALSRRLRRVFVAAGFPPASQLLFLLNHRLSQSIVSFLATLPLAMSAVLLVRGDAATAVAVALPATLATAAVEGLFQLRIARPYAVTGELTSSMVCEGFLIAYIYSIICVLDTVITCMVYQTCKMSHSCDLLELEEKGDLAA
uniref:Uncharacterized protein n=1 Tax=Oryza barthii TaxID=65489 RepID=A0A0D3HUW4_9ORYZ